MMMTKRKPGPAAEIPVEAFMSPLGFTQTTLAEAMGVPRKRVDEPCDDRRNGQPWTDFWEALHSPTPRSRIERARPLKAAP